MFLQLSSWRLFCALSIHSLFSLLLSLKTLHVPADTFDIYHDFFLASLLTCIPVIEQNFNPSLNFSLLKVVWFLSRHLKTIACEAVTTTSHYCMACVFQLDYVLALLGLFFNGFYIFSLLINVSFFLLLDFLNLFLCASLKYSPISRHFFQFSHTLCSRLLVPGIPSFPVCSFVRSRLWMSHLDFTCCVYE